MTRTNTSDLDLLPLPSFLWCPQIILQSNYASSSSFCNNSEQNSIKSLLYETFRNTVLQLPLQCTPSWRNLPLQPLCPWDFHMLGWSTALWLAASALHFRNKSISPCRLGKAEKHNPVPYHPLSRGSSASLAHRSPCTTIPLLPPSSAHIHTEEQSSSTSSPRLPSVIHDTVTPFLESGILFLQKLLASKSLSYLPLTPVEA